MAQTNTDRASYFPAIEKRYGLPMSYWFEQMESVKGQKYPEQIAFLRENHGFSQAHANALVLYCRGSKSAKRFDTLDEYLAPFDETTQTTVRTILTTITRKFPKTETVIAWNHPMIRIDGQYVFGLSVLARYILIGPMGSGVLDEFADRLAPYPVNKKTFQVPLDWKVDKALVRDLAAYRLAEIEA